MKKIKLNTNTMLVKSLQEIVKADKYEGIIFIHDTDEIVVKYAPFKQLVSNFHADTMVLIKKHKHINAVVLSSQLVTQKRCNHAIGFVNSRSVKVPCNACKGLQPDCSACRGNGYIYQWARNDCKYCVPVTANGKYTLYSGAWLDSSVPKILAARSNALHIELL